MPRYSTSNVSLYLRNVPDGTRPDELRSVFSKYGQVRDIYIPSDYFTGRIRGFAYVEFEDIRDAEDAVYHMGRGFRLHGREVDVEFAVGDRKTPGQMRNKYGSPYGSRRSPSSHRRKRSRSRSRSRRRHRSRSRRRSRSRHGSRSHRRSSHGRSHRRKRSRSHRSRSRSRSRARSGSHDEKTRRTKSRSRSRSRTKSADRSRSASAAVANGDNNVGDEIHDELNLDQDQVENQQHEMSNPPSENNGGDD